jgi:hypothetical protein
VKGGRLVRLTSPPCISQLSRRCETRRLTPRPVTEIALVFCDLGGYGLDSAGSGYGPVTGQCEHALGPLALINDSGALDWPSDCCWAFGLYNGRATVARPCRPVLPVLAAYPGPLNHVRDTTCWRAVYLPSVGFSTSCDRYLRPTCAVRMELLQNSWSPVLAPSANIVNGHVALLARQGCFGHNL